MLRINLLPYEIEKKAAARKQIFLASVAGAVVVFIVAGCFLMRVAKIASLKKESKKADAELSRYNAELEKIQIIENQKKSLQTRLSTIDGLMASQLNYPKMMEVMTLPSVLPANVWLKTFTTRDAGPEEISFIFDAEAADNYAVADFLTNLEKSPLFDKVIIRGFTAGSGPAGEKTRALNVSCMYKPQKGKP
ncbi:MAG: PilN domain-containing protein [bacterium]